MFKMIFYSFLNSYFKNEVCPGRVAPWADTNPSGGWSLIFFIKTSYLYIKKKTTNKI